MMDHHPEDNANSLGHEPIETNVRAVWRTAAVIVGVVIGAYVLIIGLMNWFALSDTEPSASQQTQFDPTWDEQNRLQQLRSREQDWLNQYQWVDPAAGIARVPVDRAMEIVSQNGLPATLPAAGPADSRRPPNAAQNDGTTPEGNQP